MIKLIKRLMRCRVVMINFDEKPTVMRSDLLQPRTHYRKRVKLS